MNRSFSQSVKKTAADIVRIAFYRHFCAMLQGHYTLQSAEDSLYIPAGQLAGRTSTYIYSICARMQKFLRPTLHLIQQGLHEGSLALMSSGRKKVAVQTPRLTEWYMDVYHLSC
jgi:hypothetical protein